MRFSSTTQTLVLLGAVAVSVAVVGMVGARAQTENLVTQSAFEAERRALREEIYNLRQRVLGQEVTSTMRDLIVGSEAARSTADRNLRTKVCAQAAAALRAQDLQWVAILRFWPLGSITLERLEEFRLAYRELCPSSAT